METPQPVVLSREVLIARFVANMQLTSCAGLVSRRFDVFSSWIVAGFGAALSLILSNLTELSEIMPVASVIQAVRLFGWAAGLCLLQKYIAVIVGGSAQAAANAIEKPDLLAQMDPVEFQRLLISGTPGPARWIATSMMEGVAKNPVHMGTVLIRLAIAQGLMMLIQAGLLLAAFAQLTVGLADK